MKLISNDESVQYSWVEASKSLITLNYLELGKGLHDMITFFFAYPIFKGGTSQRARHPYSYLIDYRVALQITWCLIYI